jgi:transposase
VFTYAIDERTLTHAHLLDGKLLLVTNTTDPTPEEVVKRYKSLADIECGFRVLKSEIEIEICPIYHRPLERIRAHAAICFMALILYRVMRTHLRASDTALSPERALAKLRQIQHHRVTMTGTAFHISKIATLASQSNDLVFSKGEQQPRLRNVLNYRQS